MSFLPRTSSRGGAFCYLAPMRRIFPRYVRLSNFLWCCCLLLASCGAPDGPDGMASVTLLLSPATPSLDLLDPAVAVSLEVQATVPEKQTLTGIFIEKSFNGQPFVVHESLSTWPTTLSYSLEALLVSWQGVSLDQLRRGDEIRLRAYPAGVAAFERSEEVSLPLSCSSALAGNYLAKTVGRAGPGGGGAFDTIRYDVTLTSLGDARYEVSEVSGGMYPIIWSGKAQAGIISDSCGMLQLLPQADQWGDTILGVGEVLHPEQVYYQWQNSYGDQGQTWLIRE